MGEKVTQNFHTASKSSLLREGLFMKLNKPASAFDASTGLQGLPRSREAMHPKMEGWDEARLFASAVCG